MNQFAHAAQRRVLAGAADFDFQNAGEILRAGKNFVAGFFVGGQRFAGDGRLVERALAAHDDAVRRDVVAGADADDVADGKFAGGDFFLAAVLLDAARLGGREFDERFDGIARALGGARLDDFAGEHEEGDDAGGLVIAGRERGEHGDGDEFVDAQAADAQILDGGDDDGIDENDRADQRAGAGDACRRIRNSQSTMKALRTKTTPRTACQRCTTECSWSWPQPQSGPCSCS